MSIDDLFTLFIIVVGALSFFGRRRRPQARGPVEDLDLDTEVEAGEPMTERRSDSLSDLLRQIQLEHQRRSGIAPRPSEPMASAEDVEDRETLEVEPVILERVPTVYAPPKIVDLDSEADEVIQRRLREAAARNRGLTLQDHRAFDLRIRSAQPPRSSRSAKRGRSRVQDAIVWKEILGTPVAIRDGGPLDY